MFEVFSSARLLAFEEHYQDLRRAAQQEQFIRQIRAEERFDFPLHFRALTWLGKKLVDLGWRLQERYDKACEASFQQFTQRVEL